MPKKIKKRSKKQEEELIDDEIVEEEDPEALAVYDEDAGLGDMVVAIPEHERDAFQMASARAADWIEGNRPIAIGIFFAVVALPFIAYGIYEYSKRQEADASAVVSEAITVYSRPVEGSPSMQLFEQNEKLKKPEIVYATHAERWQAVYDEASQGLSTHKDGPLSVAARYSKASAAYHLGKYAEAVDLYNAVLSDERGSSMRPFATLGLAMSQAGAGDVDAAVESFDTLGAIDDEFSGLALYHKGRVYESAGKKEEAKAAYHELLETSPDTSYKSDVERRIATL